MTIGGIAAIDKSNVTSDSATELAAAAIATIRTIPLLDSTKRSLHQIGNSDLTLEVEPKETSDARVQISESWIEEGPEDFSGAFQDCDIGEFAVGDFLLAEAKRDQFIKRLNEWRKDNARIVVYFQTEGEIERFRELISADALQDVDLVLGTLARGFCFPNANLVILSAAELFGRFAPHARRRLYHAERHRAQIDFSELNEDDLVVHLEHGVARFAGLTRIPTSTKGEQEVLALEFADEAKQCPVTRLAPTRSGNANSNIRFRFAKRPTR